MARNLNGLRRGFLAVPAVEVELLELKPSLEVRRLLRDELDRKSVV